MSMQAHRRAYHAHYIAAVGHGLEARDIRVADATVTISADGRRGASLLLRPDANAFAERVPAEASASWDEEKGWSLFVRRESLASHIYKGLGVVPDPEDVAAWAVALLAHPELTPSREDHPFRDHCGADPELETLLADYAAAG
jgi:hypothetical protein